VDWSYLAIIVQLIFLEGILSIDNAAILGAMVSGLPEHEPIPWPKVLRKPGRLLDKLLGAQRGGALRVGLIGAYLGRGLMLLAASAIIKNPWLRLIGAAYLVRLALDDLSAPGYHAEEGAGERRVRAGGFWMTVLNVELMDLAFSLDNVVAAVSLSDKLVIVFIGVAIGILVMRYAAGIFSTFVEKAPVLKTAAYILVFNIGVELLLEDFQIVEFTDWARFGISVVTIALCLAYARFGFMRIFRPMLVWLAQGLGIVNAAIDWALAPLAATVRLFLQAIRGKPAPAG
jgi:tellurite resistance protein TerC